QRRPGVLQDQELISKIICATARECAIDNHIQPGMKASLLFPVRYFLHLALVSAFAATAQAQVVADGAPATLTNVTSNINGAVTIGTNGSFTLLILTNAALLTNSGIGVIGRNIGANSNTVRLTSANTRWLMSLDHMVGSNGAFNRLIV